MDEVVRANQLACLPFAKSGRAGLLLHERHPSLAGDIDAERQRKLRDMTFRLSLREDENRFASPFRVRVGSLDDMMSSPSSDRASRRKAVQSGPLSPSIRPKESASDLMFDMDDDESMALSNAVSPLSKPLDPIPRPSSTTISLTSMARNKGKSLLMAESPLASPSQSATPIIGSPPTNAKPWSSPVLPSEKLDMREIMSQASTTRKSSLSMEISAQREKEAAARAAAPKLSQKERKKQQQQALLQAQAATKSDEHRRTSGPWQVATSGPRINLKDVVAADVKPTLPAAKATLQVPAVTRAQSTPRPRAASPDTRFSGQARSSSSQRPKTPTRPSANPSAAKPSPLAPQSKSYTRASPRAEPTLQLSMADIIGQQKREQDLIREAVQKRSLQEIQEEQAFQEWWDQESRRAQEEEARRGQVGAQGAGGKAAVREKAFRRGGRGRGRGQGNRGGKDSDPA